MNDVVACPNCGQHNRIRSAASGVPKCGKCHATLPWVVHSDTGTFARDVDTTMTVVVDFWAPWCGPCRMISPILEELAHEYAGRLKVVKVNVDENPELGRRYGARSIPLLVVMKGGREVNRIVGALPKPALLSRLSPYL